MRQRWTEAEIVNCKTEFIHGTVLSVIKLRVTTVGMTDFPFNITDPDLHNQIGIDGPVY